MRATLLLLLCGLAIPAQARVFNINKETFAAYFLFTGGATSLGTSPFKGEAASTVAYSGDINYNYSGEFGFVYSRSFLNTRFGIEIMKPTALESTATTAGSEVYKAESEILGFAPKLALEFNLHGNNTSRSYLSVAGGLANVTMKNHYTFSAGQTQFPSLSDHSIDAKGSATLWAAALGYENLLTDTTTIAVEMGYRMMTVDNLQYTKDVSTFGGSKSSGDDVTNYDGTKRSLNFSGGFISIAFRFYL